MKKYLTLILFVCVTAISFAQNNYQDVVYLKNGSVIRGIIVEQVPNKSIKIETSDKSIFVYQMDDIEKLTKEQMQVGNDKSFDNLGFKSNDKDIIKPKYKYGFGISGATLFPMATFGDFYDSGSGFAAKVFLNSAKKKGGSAFGISIGMAKFKTDEFSSLSSSVMPITIFNEDYIGKGKVKAMVGYEMGGYNFKTKGSLYGYEMSDSKMKFGIGPYLGLLVDLTKQLSLLVDAKYNYILDFNNLSDSPSWLGVHIGLDYKF